MKKQLFAFGLCLIATPAIAGEWSYDASGTARGAYGYSDVAERFEKQDKNNNTFGDAEVNLNATYEAEEDYFLSLNLDAMLGVDEELQDYNQGRWGEEAYLIAGTPYGELQGGQMYNVGYQFYDGAPRVGILRNNSDMVNFIQNPNWKRNGKETQFSTLNATYSNTDGVAPKASYITPEFYGTKAGVTYVPDAYSRRGLIDKHADYESDDGFVGALGTEQDLGWFDASASASYAQYHKDDKEFSSSLKFKRGNWSLGGGYRKSYVEGTKQSVELFDAYREGQAWEVGLGYEVGPLQSALTYFESKADNFTAKDKVLMFSNQYQFNKYVLAYLAVAHVDFESAEENNQGYAFISGLGLTF